MWQASTTSSRDGQAEGYRVGILRSGDAGLPLYCRLGVREYCSIVRSLCIPKEDEGGD